MTLKSQNRDIMDRMHPRFTVIWHLRRHFIAVALLSSTLVSLVTANSTQRGIRVVNTSGSDVELYWVHVSVLYIFPYWEIRRQ